MNLITLVIEANIVIFAVIFGALLMIFSRIWKAKLFSILSVGVWIYLATQVDNSIPLIIVCIGLIIEETLYTVLGGND